VAANKRASDLKGYFPQPKRPVSLEEMEEAIGQDCWKRLPTTSTR
jgi:hypothetical protein